MLALFRSAGYELVMPPMIEYLDSLVADGDVPLDMKTFKLDDHFSGRQMGLRADITPQVARIDAHLLAERTGITRLCYAGSVVHARPAGLMSSREPLQIGAELYGFAGLEADLEIIRLTLDTLDLVNVKDCRLDIGSVAIFRGMAQAAGLSAELTRDVFTALRSKDVASVSQLVEQIAEPWRSAFIALPELYGPQRFLERARRTLPLIPEVEQALGQLQALAEVLADQVEISFDLTELRGAAYHTGLMFAVYAPGWPDELARGGRYDNVGRRFGRVRPATGFSLDLRDLLRILPERAQCRAICVRAKHADAARDEIRSLRQAGEVVVIDYLGESAEALNCDRELIASASGWQLVPFN